jgi:hypothetical protein
MSTLLFYDNPIALSSETHRNLKIKPSGEGLKFSGKTNSVLLAGVEFPEACKHFPIVFAKISEQLVLPVALLGFRDLENLFVDASGQWKSAYVPAYVRRYPFVLGKAGNGDQLTVCIDESYPGFGADEGQPLFNEKGESTDYLKGVLAFLQDYQAQLDRTDKFLQALRECDLLMDVSANVNLAGGEKFSIAGLMMVDERKLQALPEAQILRLFRSGGLAWVYSHLISISNFNRLPLNAPASATPAPAKPAAAAGKSPPPPPKPARK